MKSVTIETSDGQIIKFQSNDVQWSTAFGNTYIIRVDDAADILRKEMERRKQSATPGGHGE